MLRNMEHNVLWLLADYEELSLLPRLGLDERVHPLHKKYNDSLYLLVGIALRDADVGFFETYRLLNTIYSVKFDPEKVLYCSGADCAPEAIDPQPRECSQEIYKGFTCDPEDECFWRSADGLVEHPLNWVTEYDDPVEHDILNLFGANEVYYPFGRQFNRRLLQMWNGFRNPTNFRTDFENLMEEEKRLRERVNRELQQSGTKRDYTTVAEAAC